MLLLLLLRSDLVDAPQKSFIDSAEPSLSEQAIRSEVIGRGGQFKKRKCLSSGLFGAAA